MSYIRTKKIKNSKYAYLVETCSTAKGPRQKVKKYLGKIHALEENPTINDEISENDILSRIIVRKLLQLGFKNDKNKYIYNDIIFDPKKLTLQNKKKNVVLELSEKGFLCTYTLQKIRNFRKSNNLQKDGYALAQLFFNAGLEINEAEFVEYYQSLK